MAHQQLQPRDHADFGFDFVTGSENVSPSRLIGTPYSTQSTSNTILDSKDPNAPGRSSYLEELNIGALQNVQNLARITTPRNKQTHLKTRSAVDFPTQVNIVTPDSLAEDLSNFHIYSPPEKEAVTLEPESSKATTVRQTQEAVSSPLSPRTPRLQKSAHKAKHAHFALPEQPCESVEESNKLTGSVKNESFSELLSESDIQSTIERHDAKNFNWILSLPRDAGNFVRAKHLRRICSTTDLTDSASQNRKVLFGCNVLRQRSLSRSSVTSRDRAANTYTLIATPLDAAHAPTENMMDTLLPPGAAGMMAPDLSGLSPKAIGAPLDTGSFERARAQSVPRSPASSAARIEDTLEELDKLEDQFEAVHRMVRINRVASPDKEVRDQKTAKAGTGAAKSPAAKTGTTRSSLGRTSSVRRSTGAAAPAKKPTEGSPAVNGTATKRLSSTRPMSLLPPKPPAKSTKAPTTSTFELPGEAVARRLKEQREARMAAAAAAAAATTKPAVSKPGAGQLRRARSVKPPTIPTFELPGEAISRRKREEHEAKLKRQEEEERKRREFKARPIRLSVTPSTVPRETVSSRARTNRTSIIGENAATNGGLNVPGSAPPANRRLSVISSDSTGRTNGQGQVPRGRGPTLGSSPAAAGQLSRATSTSTGSISGKRSTISVEDVQYQKIRGREILQRDSILSSDRDREKREREAIAKQARQEASERSRALSREWAEKQKLKAKKTAAATTA